MLLYYFPFGLLRDLLLRLSPDTNIEITKTPSLLFILLHLNAGLQLASYADALWARHAIFLSPSWRRKIA